MWNMKSIKAINQTIKAWIQKFLGHVMCVGRRLCTQVFEHAYAPLIMHMNLV